MKTNTLLFFSIFLAIILFLASCKKDDPLTPVENPDDDEPDVELVLPEVELILPSGIDLFWNTVELQVTASDADGDVVLVEVFANNELIASLHDEPYTINWNTRNFADGDIVLKAVATDNDEQQTEATVNVKVLNTLVDFNIPEGYLLEDNLKKYYVYITTAQREVIYFSQIEEEPFTGKAERPETFEDATFELHFMEANGLEASLTTYSDFTPGVFAPVLSQGAGKLIREGSLTFFDVPEHDYFTFDKFAGNQLQNDLDYKFNVYENIDFSYLYMRQGEEGTYKILHNIQNTDQEVSLNVTNIGMTSHQITINEFGHKCQLTVAGHTANHAASPAINIYKNYGVTQDAFTFDFHTPDNVSAFKHFSGELLLWQGSVFYENMYYFDIPESLTKINVNFTGNNGSTLADIQNTAIGEDFDVLNSKYFIDTDNISFEWNCYSPSANITFPPIPAQLTHSFPNLNASNIMFKPAIYLLSAEKYDHLDSFSDYLDALSGRNGKALLDGASKKISTGKVFQ